MTVSITVTLMTNALSLLCVVTVALLLMLPDYATALTRLDQRSPPALPLHTSSRWIVDSTGKRVKLACVNWSGAAQKDGVVSGLQHAPRQKM